MKLIALFIFFICSLLGSTLVYSAQTMNDSAQSMSSDSISCGDDAGLCNQPSGLNFEANAVES